MKNSQLNIVPRVSIIIPCYNHGHYLKDALESVRKCDDSLYELIIVNDGSTDPFTNQILKDLYKEGITVIFQENKGLASARNTGIAYAQGKYILPLDADNKIRPEYLTKAIDIMENDPHISIVYGNAQHFGQETNICRPGSFNLQRLMIGNFIDACAIIRKSSLQEVGLYDVNMPYMGWEDWDVYLRLAFAGKGFYYVDEVLFDYRISESSMSKAIKRTNYIIKTNAIDNYLFAKYADKLGQEWIINYFVKRFKTSPVMFIVKLFIRTYVPSYYYKLLSQNKIRNGI